MKLFKIVIIVLKITEFVSLLIATANVGHFMKETRDKDEDSSSDPYNLGHHGRLEFFLFTTSVGMIVVMVTFLLFITGLQEKINGNQTMAEVHAIWTLMLLVSSGLFAKTVNDLDSKDTGFGWFSKCDFYQEIDADYQCSHLMTAVVLGFAATFFFLLDSSIYIFTFMTSQAVQSKQAKGVV